MGGFFFGLVPRPQPKPHNEPSGAVKGGEATARGGLPLTAPPSPVVTNPKAILNPADTSAGLINFMAAFLSYAHVSAQSLPLPNSDGA